MVKSSTERRLPERTCVVCRQTQPKKELVRLVRTAGDGVLIDLRGKAPGRGSYLCRRRECWERALAGGRKDPLGRSLKINITDQNRETLMEYGQTLPRSLTKGKRGVG